MSSAGGDALTAREQRRIEREERKRRRAAQESTKTPADKKMPGKDDKRTKKGSGKDFSSSNGSTSKNPPSGTKQTTTPSYEKMNIIEKTAKFDFKEKEKKPKKKTEAPAKLDSSSTRRKFGSKFLDNMSKFESQANQSEKVNKNPFVRSYSSSTSAAADPSFRRSYRTSRTTPAVDDPSILVRRSLRKERVLESIAKLERKSSTDDGTTQKNKPPSLAVEKPHEKSKPATSRPSSASSSKASLSDSGSSTSSTKGLTRAQQALKRHQERMEKSSQSSKNGPGSAASKATTPNGKTRSKVSRKTPVKSKSTDKESPETPATDELKSRKISVTTTPVDGDIVEVITVTEVMTPAAGKMNIVVKEIAASEEESDKIVSPAEDIEYEFGDLRPVSVEDTVAKFSEAKPLVTPTEVTEEEKPRRVRRKLPEIPVEQPPQPIKSRRRSSKKEKQSQGSSGEPSPTRKEQEVVIIETSPTFQQTSEALNVSEADSPSSGQNLQFKYNYNENSNSEPKSVNLGQASLMREVDLDHERKPLKHDQNGRDYVRGSFKGDDVTVEHDTVRHQMAKDESSCRSFSPDEAIEVLRRLSEEIQSSSTGTNDRSSVAKSSIVTSQAIQEEGDHYDQSKPISEISEIKLKQNKEPSKKRPVSLHIEEVLFISEETGNRPRSTSPQKRSVEEVVRTPSPRKFCKSSLKTFSKEFSTPEASRTPSPQKSPAKPTQKSPLDPPKTLFFEYPQEITFFDKQTALPQKSSRPLSKTPESPTKSPIRVTLPDPPQRSPTKTPTLAPMKVESPVKSPVTEPESFLITAEQVIESGISAQENRSPSPTKDKTTKSPSNRVRTPSPTKRVESPIEQSEHKPFLSKFPEPQIRSPSPPAHTLETQIRSSSPPSKTPEPPIRTSSPASKTSEPTARTPSPARTPSSVKTSPKKMLATRRTFAPRYQKSWLDESDSDDNISLLSDAASDASSIDMDWLGKDSSDEDGYGYVSKKTTKTNSSSSGVQRSSSSAQDMLKMWEKKVTEPKPGVRSASTKLPSESVKRVGSMRAAWETKRDSPLHDSSSESIDSSQEKRNGSSHHGSESPGKISSTPSTPSHANHRAKSSPGDDSSVRSSSGSDWKTRPSESESQEITDIFDEKTSGKIQGAKALFENLASSPKRSPSLRRSPRRRAVNETAEDNVFPSRESSRASESSDAAMPMDSLELTEDAPKVDNMRAMFEKKTNKKPEVKKHKPSQIESGNSKTPKSSIQKKVAARKKKGRRSMTQPVTSEDVVKAHDVMNGKRTKTQSDTDEEEDALNFVDRLKFFNLLTKQTSSFKGRARKRSDTQPVRALQVHEAAEAIKKKHTRKKVGSPETLPLKSPGIKPAPVEISRPQNPVPVLSARSPSSTVQRLTRKFSLSSSSDTESLLSSSSTSIDDTEPGRKKLLLSSSEDSSDMSVNVAETKVTGSIHDRLKKLQRNTTEEKWRKQTRNAESKSSLGDRLNKLKSNEEKWKKPAPSAPTDFVKRAERLSDRIAKMKEDSKGWKEKTGKQNDAAQFTVQAKLAKKDGKKAVVILPSPLIKRRVLPVAIPSRETVVSETDVKQDDDSASMNQLSFVEKLSKKGLEENVIKKTEVLTTEVPAFDHEEFEKFFGTSDDGLTNGYSEIELDIENLPELENKARLSDIGRFKSGLKQPNKRGSSKRNPLKALAARTDLKQSYDTERLNVAKLEQQRIAVQRGHGANFTAAAIAGLAAKADLKNVNLRSTKSTPMPSNDDLKPFNNVMLLRAKGRRQVQTRLVEPCPGSLCSDDAYLLVTPNKLFGWFGEFCNVIERAKINEIADYIVIKGDLGCKVSALKTIEENMNPDTHKDFWKIIGGFGEWDKTTTPGGDEEYEVDVETTIKTYKMINSKLVPNEEAWGKFPKMGMLGSSDTFVFDFGAEMYIWQGKEVSFADRRLAVRLARVLWEQEYDYTEHGFSPFHAKELKGKRPDYGLFARVNENLETSLFQEKFPDWSNIHREIGHEESVMRETSRGKAIKEIKNKSAIATEMESCDVTKLREEKASQSPLIIEGYDVALGDGDVIDEDGRVLEIMTSDVEPFYITENKIEKLPDSVLHRENSYVLKWSYSISSTGRFEMSGKSGKSEKSGKSSTTENGNNGRQRVAFFSWTGPDSAMTEKGASALIATNMDTDEGPVISLQESTAPPVFNRCFHGNMVVMSGKRGVKRGGFSWKLFKVKGHSQETAALVEVPCECKSLRSCSSFVTMLARDATAIVWHGCRSPKNVREAAEETIKKLSDRMPGSIPFRRGKTSIIISECEEGEETDLFWEAIGVKRRNRYECLIDVDTPTLVTRAWRFDIQSDLFVADELQPVEHDTVFHLVQEQLTEAEKPSMILVDCTHGAFLWQNVDSDSLTGSAKRRWDVIRRLSMETAINYCKEHEREEARLIEAGMEPISLKNAFPSWTTKEKQTIDKLLPQKYKLVSEVLSTISRLTYTLEELRAKELPDGVDASHLESYLTCSDFEKLFEMTKKQFYELPSWKQMKLRRDRNLF